MHAAGRLLLIALASILALTLSAGTAAAEPTGWNMICKQPNSSPRAVSNPMQCREGEIRFVSWKTGKTDAYLDVDKMETRYKRNMSYREFEKKCTGSLVCSVGAGIVATVFGKKLKLLWKGLRAL
ncbi:MAG TPA: hypothetical protein VF635_06400 [Propionibacteriaceae bacterium]|jgi:hypothetical protein